MFDYSYNKFEYLFFSCLIFLNCNGKFEDRLGGNLQKSTLCNTDITHTSTAAGCP